MIGLRRFGALQRGTATIEMAIILPLLVVMAAGGVEFGNALYNRHMVDTGIRDAARYLARFEDPMVEAANGRQIALYGSVSDSHTDADKRISWWNASDIAVNVIDTANPVDAMTGQRLYRGGDPIKVVRVSTSVTNPGVGLLRALGLDNGVPITVYHDERLIGW